MPYSYLGILICSQVTSSRFRYDDEIYSNFITTKTRSSEEEREKEVKKKISKLAYSLRDTYSHGSDLWLHVHFHHLENKLYLNIYSLYHNA